MGSAQRTGLLAAAAEFEISGRVVEQCRHGQGRIHESWLVVCDTGRRYVFQRLNAGVFRDLGAVMENIARVTEHLGRALARSSAPALRPLRMVPVRSGASWLALPEGGGWRAWEFVEGTLALERAETPDQAYQAARAFGSFAALLDDLPPPPLRDTIPGFHDTAARVAALRAALDRDPVGRAAGAQREIEQALAHAELAGRIPALVRSAGLRLRAVHNDTKLDNVLFDAASGQAVCVIDLDTVMPGHLAFDFGDLVRSAANAAPEDGTDPAQAELRLPFFEAIARGYLEGSAALQGRAERASLQFAAPLITYEIAVRFLTDHLCGDVYFPVARAGQNLERCRIQLGLLASMQAQSAAMLRCLERA
jgi:aminoglycoside phosphotransferase (APT) family kinase protein